MQKIRIVDIARMANVSPGTVDRVLHHRGGVSEKTRMLIEKLIDESGFKKDILAGALASNKTYHILVCMPSAVPEHAFWKLPERGVNRAKLEFQPFNIEIAYLRFDQHNKDDFITKTSVIVPENYDGLLFAPVFREESVHFLSSWNTENKHIVLFNSFLEAENVDGFIGQDAFQSGYLGGRLMSFGLPQDTDLLAINLSLRKDHYDHIIQRERGFRAYFDEHPNKVDKILTLDMNGGEYPEIRTAVDRILEEHNIAGIFVTNSRVHLLGRYLAEKGINHFRLVGYDLLQQSVEYLQQEYIDFLISQSPEEQAYRGMRSLFDMLVMGKDQPGEILLPIDILTKENVDYYLKTNAQYEQPE